MKKTQFYKILFLSCFWVSSTAFIAIYEASTLGFKSTVEGGSYHFWRTLFFPVSLSALSATSVAFFEVLYLNKLLRKKPFGVNLLVKTTFYLICLLIFLTITSLLLYSHDLGLPMMHEEVVSLFLEQYVFSARLLMSLLYYGFAVVFALFVVQVSDKYGQGVLIDFLLGRYHRPKEENRIFMFMDLKSSTTYAERLGHIEYSQLIQDCFYDLTDVVARYNAKIYQYVGDEVVLTWEVHQGLANANCLHAFFAYDDAINRKGSYYQKKFGLIPEFKAALNIGSVTLAEVGELKKELAYHGEVIITAARIQEKCNAFGARILVSEQMKNAINPNEGFAFNFVGDVLLKGKTESVNIYEVKMDSDH